MKAVVTVIGIDKPGIIAKISGKLFEENVNILDLYNDPDFSFDNELFRSYVKADGLHPNDDGHRAIAKKIYEYVKNM